MYKINLETTITNMEEKSLLSIQLYIYIYIYVFLKKISQVFSGKFLMNPHFSGNFRCSKKFQVFQGFARCFTRAACSDHFNHYYYFFITIELTHSTTILQNTVKIEPQPVALDFKNISQYSSHSK